jgi:hypothetical protein
MPQAGIRPPRAAGFCRPGSVSEKGADMSEKGSDTISFLGLPTPFSEKIVSDPFFVSFSFFVTLFRPLFRPGYNPWTSAWQAELLYWNPYFLTSEGMDIMLAKITSKNQLTLPKNIVSAFPDAEYFDIQVENGRIVLTPVRIQKADAVRAKLEELGITERDIGDAVQWARREK